VDAIVPPRGFREAGSAQDLTGKPSWIAELAGLQPPNPVSPVGPRSRTGCTGPRGRGPPSGTRTTLPPEPGIANHSLGQHRCPSCGMSRPVVTAWCGSADRSYGVMPVGQFSMDEPGNFQRAMRTYQRTIHAVKAKCSSSAHILVLMERIPRCSSPPTTVGGTAKQPSTPPAQDSAGGFFAMLDMFSMMTCA